MKAGAIFFRPCGTEFARGATACPRSDRMGSPVDGEHGIPDNPNGPTPNGVEQICIPCPKLRGSNPPPAAFGGHPRQRGTEEAGRIHPRPRTGACSRRRPRRDGVSPFGPDGQPRGAAPTRGSGTLRYKKPHAKLTPGKTTIFVSLCLGVNYDAMGNRLTQRHQDTKEDHSGRAANCFVAQACVVPVGRLLPGFLALGVRIPVSYTVRIMFSMERAWLRRTLDGLTRSS